MGSMPDPDKKEKAVWYEKLTEDKNAGELIRDAYRNKDVLLLDSIHGPNKLRQFYALDA